MNGILSVAQILAAIALLVAAPNAAAQIGRTIDLDGFDVHVVTAGWEHAAPGMPTVVFESGSTLPAEVWAPVVALVAQAAPVVAFDPAGVGESEWDGARRTDPEVPPTPSASPNGTLVLAAGSGHCIQCDDPELVAWAIRRVLDASREDG